MVPPLDVQREIDVHGNRIQELRDKFKQTALEDQKKSLVDAFYNQVSRAYWLRPKGNIDYDQLGIDPDGKTFLWTPGDKKFAITATRGRFRFLALSTLASRCGDGGTNALRRSLGLTGYRAGTTRLSSAAVEALRQGDEAVSENVESVELENLSSFANSTLHGSEKVGATLTTA